MRAWWKIDGFQSAPRPSGTPRNQLGFKDGIANPDVWEPSVACWWNSGTGCRCRNSSRCSAATATRARRWTGRHNRIPPDYASDPDGLVIPLTAHIRLANPRTAATASSRILRRGYNYDRGFDDVGNLDVSLVFCCYHFFALPGVRGPDDYLGSGLL
jgi:deferrochelatase/peroxidase EfeB